MIFPWHTQQWDQLWRSKQDNCLPHALLFAGMRGVGKTTFATAFIRALLCGQTSHDCHTCQLIANRTHPNLLWIEPEQPGHAIKIDQVRQLIEFIQQSSLQGEYRIAVIHPANHMNAHAANALLKTLEEPSSGSLIILISDQSSPLPATILSRCQRIIFSPPPSDQALQWLNSQVADDTIDTTLLLHLANGAPLYALQLVQNKILSIRTALFQALHLLSQQQGDPVSYAAKMQDHDLVPLLDFILSWMMDLLRLQLCGDADRITNRDYEQQLVALGQQYSLKNNAKFMEYLHQVRKQICMGINLNKQLLLESIFIRWAECA